ncbi:hypothetical protein [Actinoplanes sp. NPDC026619]|uniref:hypothetical protein n=1 Tax=Actinoplanes sp. NPDC026619 TaxID=3155798 RepID=UPI0033D51F8C
MRAKRLTAGAVAGVTALAFAGACAGEIKKLEPKLELRAAAQHLADAKQAGFTVKFTGDADALIKAAKTDGDDLRTLLNSSATIAYDAGGDGPDDDRSMLSATIDGVTGTEIRVVGTTLYAKAPVKELAKKFGEDDPEILREEVTTGVGGFDAFFDGKWVALDVKDAAKAGLPAEDVDSAKALTEVKKSGTALFDGATIVRDAADSKHLIVTSSTTKAYTEVKRLVTAVGGAETADLTDEMDEAPKDRPIVLDLWIDKGNLTALEVNVLQFIDGATGRAAIRLDVTTGATIDVPTGATKVDSSALSSLIGSGAEPAGATGFAEMLGYEAISLADENGGKPSKHLKEAIADMAGSGATARLVRTGVAEVTAGGSKACVKLPATTNGEPKVVKGAC